MRYRNKSVKDTPTEILLFEILQRMGSSPCPRRTSYAGEWVNFEVAIGKDHTANIRMPLEDKGALDRIITEYEQKKAG